MRRERATWVGAVVCALGAMACGTTDDGSVDEAVAETESAAEVRPLATCSRSVPCPPCQTCDLLTGRCATASDGTPCGTCDSCVRGACTGAGADGDPCGNAASTECDRPDVCKKGNCVSNFVATGTSCADDGNACTKDQCNGQGTCAHSPDTGARCDDGDSCTSADACDATAKCGGKPYTCTPTDCQAASRCDGNGGCSITHQNDGVSCDLDQNRCTVDQCKSGVCTNVDDVRCPLRECNDAQCDRATGNCEYTPTQGSPACGGGGCSNPGTCGNGVCSGGNAKDCTPLDAVCKVGLCDGATGSCVQANADNGIDCPKPTGACFKAGACDNGECKGVPADDGSPCTKTGCTFGSVCGAGVCLCNEDPGTGGAAGTGGSAGSSGAGGTSGSSGAGGSAGSAGGGGSDVDGSAGTAGDANFAREPGGCSCRVGEANTAPPDLAWLGFGALALLRRRRRAA